MSQLHILNSSDQKKTLSALKAIREKADPKGRAEINRLIKALSPTQDAGRARKEPKMAKKIKRAKRTTRARTNPTAAVAAPAGRAGNFKRRARAAGANVAAKLKNVDIQGLIVRGGCMAGGFLAQSFIARQSERMLPSLPKAAHSVVGSAVVAAAALMLAGGKPWAEDIAAAGVAAGIQGLAHTFAPGVFAGDEEESYYQGVEAGAYQAYQQMQGTEDPYDVSVQGVAALEDDQMSGLAYSGRRLPDGLATRPSYL